MLAVFHRSVAECPIALKITVESESEAHSALLNDAILDHFVELNPDAFTVTLGTEAGFLCFSDHQDSRPPRRFACANNVFCMFHGHFENEAELKERYVLTQIVDECEIVLAAHTYMRQRPLDRDEVFSFMKGKFAFIVYDKTLRSIIVAVDADGSLPFYWGVDSEDKVVLSTDIYLLKKACVNSYGPFPHGCFFSSENGLQSFKFPGEVVNPMRWRNRSGEGVLVTWAVAGDEKNYKI